MSALERGAHAERLAVRLAELMHWREALVHEMAATSAALLAEEMLGAEPSAVRLILEDGDPLRPRCWVDQQGRSNAIAASMRWCAELRRVQGLPGPLGLSQAGDGAWVLDLDLARRAGGVRGPLVEVLAVRDPDGPVEITAAALGMGTEARVVQVDAGAGWSAQAWEELRQDGLVGASRVMRPLIEEAFADPPGSRYITQGDA